MVNREEEGGHIRQQEKEEVKVLDVGRIGTVNGNAQIQKQKEESKRRKQTKGTAKRKAGVVPIDKGIGIQQYIGYAPEKCNTRGEGIEDEVESNNICKV